MHSCPWLNRATGVPPARAPRLRKGWKKSVRGGLPIWDLPHAHPPTQPSTCWSSQWREKLCNTPFLQQQQWIFKDLNGISQVLNVKLIIIPAVFTPSYGTLPRGTHNLCCDGSTYLGHRNMLPPCFLSSCNSMEQEGQSKAPIPLPQKTRNKVLPNIQLPWLLQLRTKYISYF